MNNKLFNACLSFVIIGLSLISFRGQAQNLRNEDFERKLSFWSSRMEMVRGQVGADKKDFGQFSQFYKHELDSIHIDFINKVRSELFTIEQAKQYTDSRMKYFANLYSKYTEVKKEFPSSVAEFKSEHRPRLGGDSCFSSCYNTNFEDGTLDGWYGYYGYNSSTTSFNITSVTGGYCGAVKKAGGPDPFTNNDYQIRVTSGTAVDPFLQNYASISYPEVSPWGGNYSVMIGDSNTNGYGAAILSQSFLVNASTASLSYQYSVFLERNPSHTFYIQPYFTVLILDASGDTIPICGEYSQSALNAGEAGFNKTYYPTEGDTVYWRPWTFVNVPLKNYIGQCITVLFEIWDCAAGGHFGYAYVDASCSPLQLISSSPNICGQDSISLTAPPGAQHYQWFDSAGIMVIDTFQTVWVSASGTYTVVVTPVTGSQCADTLTIHVGVGTGPPPKPDFSTNTVCSGTPTHFINTSNDTSSATFYWDFYNIGVYNDSVDHDPYWTYVSPGVYYVKLHEVYNGCGSDTVIKVTVDSTVNGSFSAPSVCIGSGTGFTFTGTGATTYSWNFGDTLTLADTSHVANPFYTYTAVGTYTVTLISANGGPCPDTLRQTIRVDSIPLITGIDTICVGQSDTLRAYGGNTYLWNNGATTSSIVIAPAITRTITVTIDGACTSQFVVTPVNAPTASITASADSVCAGAPDTLFAHGGTAYKWSNGKTTSSIVINPLTTITDTLTAYLGSVACSGTATITIGMINNVSAMIPNKDTVCAGSPAALTVLQSGGGAISYKWSTGQTTTAITVTPDSTTTYYVLAKGTCNTDSVPVTVQVIPLPVPKITGNDTVCTGFKDTLSVSGAIGYTWSDGSNGTTDIVGAITADTTIYVVATTGKGMCIKGDSIRLKVKLPPTVSATKGIVCSGSCITLIGSASGRGNTYSWSDGTTSAKDSVCPDSTTTYYLYVTNGCKAPRYPTKVSVYPINLYACCDQTIVQGNSATITAGQARTYTWIPAVDCLDPRCDSVKVTPSVTTSYTVSGVDSDGCADVRVVTIDVDIPCFDVVVPNVFTPNGDGVNDVFLVSTVNNYNQAAIDTVLKKGSPYYGASSNLNAYSISIYDRWGKEMYTSTNPDAAWDGTTKSGAKAADGVYYYIISATCDGTAGIVNTKKDGFVQLIRGK